MWSNKCWNLGCNTFPWSIGCVPANIFQEAVGHSCFQGTELNSPSGPWSHSCRAAPQAGLLHWRFLATGSTLHLSLLSVIQFLSASYFSMSRLPWTAAWPSRISSICSLYLVSSADSMQVNSIHSSRLRTKTRSRMGPRRHPSDTPGKVWPISHPSLSLIIQSHFHSSSCPPIQTPLS